MEASIDEIFEFLSWNNSDEIQKRGIELANCISYLSVLIMPIENKSVWENCAKVLIGKSDDELELYLFELFGWLKDMNWPGAYLIYDRLISFPTEKFLPPYQHSLFEAKQMKDHIWEMVLNDLFVEFIFNLIDWHMPEEKQAEGRQLACNIENISPFIQPRKPKFNKNVWQNCALIIAEKNDECLKPCLVELLEWLQDMNWPGASCILNRLLKYSDNESICNAVCICLKRANSCGNDIWKNNLRLLPLTLSFDDPDF